MTRYTTWLWLIPVLLLAAVLGSKDIGIPVWFDEYVSIYNAGGTPYGPLPPAAILERVRLDDFQTPGHYLLLAGWGALAGWSPLAGRMLSLLCGLLAIAGVYRLGRDLVSPLAGLGAGTAMASSAFFANYMHEMRAYILYALLTTAAVWLYWRIMYRRVQPGRLEQIGLVIALAGLFYTHYFASLTVVMIGAYHVLFVRKNARWWRISGLIALSGVLFLPWLGFVLDDLAYATRNPAAVRPLAMDNRAAFESVLRFFSNGGTALLVLIALYSLLHPARRVMRFAWFWVLTVLGIALLVNAWLGVLFSIRHLTGLWPALALLTGVGLDRMTKAGLKPALALSIWITAGIWVTADPAAYGDLRQPFAHLHWDRLAAELDGRAQADDTVLFLVPYPANTLLHLMVSQHYLQGIPGAHRILESPRLIGDTAFNADAQAIVSGAGRLWIGYDAGQPPDYLFNLDTILIQSHVVCATVANTPDLHLNLYAPLPAAAAISYQFGDSIRLTPLVPIVPAANRSLNVMLAQTLGAGVNPALYSVGLHVDDSAGQLVAQADFGLSTEPFACRSSDIPLAALPAGSYRLWLLVYEWQTGARLTGTNPDTGDHGERLLLGEFSLSPP